MNNKALKILTIDDNQDNLTILKALIIESFPEAIVLSALNGQRGFEIAAIEEPDIILLDIIMPGMDGYEVCQKLKADKQLCDIPVVFITAVESNKENRIKALECGADAFLAKPIDESELTAQIRAMLKIRHASMEKKDENKRLAILVKEKTQELEEKNIKTLGLLEALRKENEARKEIQNALIKSEAKYRQIAENISDVVWTADMNMMTTYITPSVEKMLGESPDAHMKKTMEERFTPDSLKILRMILLEELENEKDEKADKNRTRIIEVEHYRADGNVIWVSMHVSFLRDKNGNIFGYQGMSRDITELKHIEEQLKQNLKDLLESQQIAHIGTWRMNLATNQVMWSEELYKMYGFDPSLPLSPYTDHMKLFTPKSWDKLSASLKRTITSGIAYELELETVKADGSNGWMWVRGEAETDSAGDITSVWGVTQDITEHKRIQSEITETKEYFETMFNTNLDAALVTRLSDGRILSVNEGFSSLTGYSRAETEGKTVLELSLYYEPTDRQRIVYILKENGYCIGEELLFQRADKSIFTGLISAKLITLKGLDYIVTNIHDITNRKEAEYALRKSEEKYRSIFDQSIAGIYLHDIEGRIFDVNKVACSQLKYSREELLNLNILDLHPNKTDKVNLPDEEILRLWNRFQLGQQIVFESEHQCKDGTIIPVQISTGAVLYEDDKRIMAMIQDISERKEAERVSKENAYRFQSLFNEMSAGAAIYKVLNDGEYGKDYIIQHFNKAALKAEGKEKTEVLGSSLYDLRPNIDQYGLIPVFQSVWKTGEPAYYPTKMYVDEKFSNWYENRVYKLPSGEIVAIFDDVTEKRQAEEALQESERKYSNYIENAPDGVFVVDEKGKYVDANKAATRITGYSIEELLKMSIRDITAEESLETAGVLFAALLETGVTIGELQYIHKNGSKKWWSINAVKLDEHHYLGFSSDITDKKKAEAELIYISYHDNLTKLHNRKYFEEELKRLDVKENLPLSIIMADTNGLKMINDSFGHSMGDELLKKAACAIKQACRAEDIIVRYGGDEFVIVLPNTNDAETLKIANSIKEFALKEEVANIELSITCGYATKHSTHESIMEKLANAENHMYSHKLTERSSMRSKQIEIIMNTLFEKSHRESQHSIRMSEICEAIAVEMKFGKQEANQMRIAGLVHDIGKIGIAEKILNKSGGLDIDERKEIERHPEAGWRILSSSNEFAELAQCVLHHHERWDGNGYPNKLKGEDIPIEARIIALADSYDAMTSERSYKAAMSHEEAIKEILRVSGTQFDPAIVDVFINMDISKANGSV